MAKEFKEKFSYTKRRIVIFVILSAVIIFGVTIFGIFKGNIDTRDGFGCLFVDIGQGDCTIIRLPDNKIMVIDSGSQETSSHNKLKKALDYMLGDSDIIDYLVLSHADNDHSGGLTYIFENYSVKNFYRPPQYIYDVDLGESTYTKTNTDYINAVKMSKEEQGLVTHINCAGLTFGGDNYSVEFLAPIHTEYNNSNEYSAVFILSVYDYKFMFTGDITEDIEREIIDTYQSVDVDVIKVAHHGSTYSSCFEFFEHYTPDYGVVSCQKNNNYGFPSSKVIRNFVKSGAKEDNLFITYNGSVYFGIGNSGLTHEIIKIPVNRSYRLIYVAIFGIIVSFVFSFMKFHKKDEF